MSKNLVICCDGTGNEFGPTNSNVVKLFQIIRRESGVQLGYYDPGVGTIAAPEAISRLIKWWTWKLGLAFGFGLKRNISEAYGYLMDHYEPGDRVFLFGFSRGAYTVRALAALVHKVGLLEQGADNQIPYAFRMFRQKTNFALAAGFKRTFARDCPIHFLGAWDTVSTVGWIYNPVTFPYTAQNPSIQVFRHAISIDERRTHFRTNMFRPAAGQDCRQVWFSGVHADVGGGYPENESGLAKITLQWLAREAQSCGLLIDQPRLEEIALASQGDAAVPDPAANQHDELKRAGWRFVEHLPRRYIDMHTEPPQPRWRWAPWSGFYLPRFVAEHSCLHESVLRRIQLRPDYRPVNLPRTYTVEQ